MSEPSERETAYSTIKSNDRNTSNDIVGIIFTEQEVSSIVHGFILAWIRGAIKINFPSVGGRLRFVGLIDVCSGRKRSNPQERIQANNQLFTRILALRTSGRIDGTFAEFKMEERIGELEQNLKTTQEIVRELLKRLTDEAAADDSMHKL